MTHSIWYSQHFVIDGVKQLSDRVSLHTGAIYGGTAWLCNRRGGGRGEEGRGEGERRGKERERERRGELNYNTEVLYPIMGCDHLVHLWTHTKFNVQQRVLLKPLCSPWQCYMHVTCM